MDLVDIDQVLNNLELSLSADERNNSGSAATRVTPVKTVPQATSASNASTSTGAAAGSAKSFVGVGQVFNSLNAYCKEIETLEDATQNKPIYDEECRRQDEQPHVEGSSKYALNSHKYSDDEYDEDEINGSNDIQKFREDDKPAVADDGQSGGSFTSDDSLTTSSCSTFSSGPSPGLDSSSNSEYAEERNIENKNNETSTQSEPLALENLSNDAECPAIMQQENEQLQDELGAESALCIEDLTTGLSSISINTVNSQLEQESAYDNQDSSVLERISVSSQLAASTSQIVECSTAEVDNEVDEVDKILTKSLHQENQMAEALNVNQKAEHEFAQPMQVQQPANPPQFVTFCATMDDISDTELDSMLQEMDIDGADSEHDIKGEDLQGCMGDAANADSFSQASTVEISEVKPLVDLKHAANIAAVEPEPPFEDRLSEAHLQPDSIASSYTSSESILDDNISNGLVDDEYENDAERPQRPNSLDIPAAGSALNTILHANAGQTPPPPSAEIDGTIMSSTGNVASLEQSNTNANLDNLQADEAAGYSDPHENIGRTPPIWVPDYMAASCMQCHAKFTMIKRRHHCRACGKVLCSVCCSQKFKLEFIASESESRVCVQCYLILTQRQEREQHSVGLNNTLEDSVGNNSAAAGGQRSPNPNNPMEYCSTIPPSQQVQGNMPPPSVIVPVGVLKKESSDSSSSNKSRKRKSVMFSDGIAPGSELASMENDWSDAKHARKNQQQSIQTSQQQRSDSASPVRSEVNLNSTTLGLMGHIFRGGAAALAPLLATDSLSSPQRQSQQQLVQNKLGNQQQSTDQKKAKRLETVQEIVIPGDPSKEIITRPLAEVKSLIPLEANALPPIYVCKNEYGTDAELKELTNDFELLQRLQHETLKFVIQKNLYVFVKILNLNCCLNRTVINFTTQGMLTVGNDEIVILLECKLPSSKAAMLEPAVPKDIFLYLQQLYKEAEMGRPISEMTFVRPKFNKASTFLGSSTAYGGFMFIRTSSQCMQQIDVEHPFLVGLLIHSTEVPWAKIFPLRLMLRLGTLYRYYPCPLISVRDRDSVYGAIADTIMTSLADFRNYTYTLPRIRGMYIHMEGRKTTVMMPRNRLDDVIKAISNTTSDNLIAFGGNFSKKAEGHLVCMQNVNDVDDGKKYSYSTQAIDIQGQTRKVTGASFIVVNESLSPKSGLSAKCSIVEDGLLIQVLPEKLKQIVIALQGHQNVEIVCGPVGGDVKNTELVSFEWVDNENDFNNSVKSPIDNHSLQGISSMRVRASFNYSNNRYLIRFTDIFVFEHEAWYAAINGPLHGSLTSTQRSVIQATNQIARSASMALVPFLDLLVSNGSNKIGLRVTLHPDNVCYEAGARGEKLPPLYMKALDEHLVPTLHQESINLEHSMTLELIYYILDA